MSLFGFLAAIPHRCHGSGSGSPYATLHYACDVSVQCARSGVSVRAVRAVRCVVTPAKQYCKMYTV